jgi:hypothetical protein
MSIWDEFEVDGIEYTRAYPGPLFARPILQLIDDAPSWRKGEPDMEAAMRWRPLDQMPSSQWSWHIPNEERVELAKTNPRWL